MRLNHNLLLIVFLTFFLQINKKATAQTKVVQNINNQKSLTDIFQKQYEQCYTLYEKELYTESLQKTLDLLKKTEKADDKFYQILSNYLIANVFGALGNKRNSILHYKKSLSIIDNLINNQFESYHKFSKKKISKYKAKILLGLGSKFQQLKKLDSAEYYYNKISEIRGFTSEIKSIKAQSYNNLSGIYIRKKKLEEATSFTKKAILIHKETNNKVSEASSLSNLASIYLQQKKYNIAKEVYFKGLNLIKKNNSSKATKFKEDIYYNLAWTLYLLKDYTAYDYQEKSYIIKDSLRDKEIRRAVEQVYAQQKVDLEKEKTTLVEEQRKLVEAKDDKTTLLFGALSILVIVISGVVVYNYKLRQKNLSLKLSENNLIQQQRIEKIKSDSQTKILNATIDGKESERKEIAEILHDNVSALLSSANMHLSATKKQFSGKTPLEIEKTQAIILEASQKVRDLSHNLISSILLKFGLEYAVKDVAKKYSNSQLKFEVCAQNISRYNQEFEIKIFNIIQELANNILKHSKANRAKISIKQEKNQLTVLVNDDGVGFSTSSSSINNGIGLNQVEARIEMMNGKLFIDSKKNKGTRISIVIPIQQKKPFKFSSVS